MLFLKLFRCSSVYRISNPSNTNTNPGGNTGKFRSSRMPNSRMEQPFCIAQNTIQQSQCFACRGFGCWRATCRANLMFQRQTRIHVNQSIFPQSQSQMQQQQETRQLRKSGKSGKMSSKELKDNCPLQSQSGVEFACPIRWAYRVT